MNIITLRTPAQNYYSQSQNVPSPILQTLSPLVKNKNLTTNRPLAYKLLTYIKHICESNKKSCDKVQYSQNVYIFFFFSYAISYDIVSTLLDGRQ